LFGKPSIIVLDEPNSNLDEVGEAALVNAILEARNRQATVIVITHRMPILQITTKLLLLQDGNVRMFGPTGEVMQALQNANNKNVTDGTATADGSPPPASASKGESA
jgi:ATP-binding cassette subfamily C exporter for protease/lipase